MPHDGYTMSYRIVTMIGSNLDTKVTWDLEMVLTFDWPLEIQLDIFLSLILTHVDLKVIWKYLISKLIFKNNLFP